MKNQRSFFRFLSNIQIISALIWTFVILVGGWITGNSDLFLVLVTAAGLHVVILAQYERRRLMRSSNLSQDS